MHNILIQKKISWYYRACIVIFSKYRNIEGVSDYARNWSGGRVVQLYISTGRNLIPAHRDSDYDHKILSTQITISQIMAWEGLFSHHLKGLNNPSLIHPGEKTNCLQQTTVTFKIPFVWTFASSNHSLRPKRV